MPSALETLLDGLIDYAGLFPPAALDLPTAADQYAAYRRSADRPALGRFVLPAARLAELDAWLMAHPPTEPWPLSVLVATDDELAQVLAFESTVATVASVEARSALAGLDRLPPTVERYVELPVDAAADAFAGLRGRGLRAKVRTGGVTADAFPDPAALRNWMQTAVSAGVPFKATAGLHHPLRDEHRLTYAPDAPRGTMFGFLNVFLTAALLSRGASADEALGSLVESDPAALQMTDDELVWRGHRFSHTDLRQLRQCVAVSFGSCSFREPLDDLAALGLRPLTTT